MFAITRRDILKSLPSLPAITELFSPALTIAAPQYNIDNQEKIVQIASSYDCGGKCSVFAHISNGVLVRVSTTPPTDLHHMPVMKACLRGRAYKNMQYSSERLKYPLIRTGRRGEGQFKRISWREAIAFIAKRLKAITKKYGPSSRFCTVNTGQSGGILTGDAMIKRLLNLTGGYLGHYHSVSMGNSMVATPYTYGTHETGSTLNTLLDSKLIILWGHNPVETIFGHTNYYLSQYKKLGGRIIVVDPRYSDTAATYADEWIPILPTTDNAMMDAMAYVIISENLQDQNFIDKFTLGFNEKSMPEGINTHESLIGYLFGKKDGIKKTPQWAEGICKVPKEKIRYLAIEYAKAKPAALIQGWGPQRHSCGERTARGATILAAITGNVGIRGGWAGGVGYVSTRKFPLWFPEGSNPIKSKISIMSWMDAVEDASKITPLDGLQGTESLSSNIKAIFCIGSNYLLGQNPNINKAKKLLEDESKVEFILNSDLFMTPSAMFADIVLPAASFLERWDVGITWATGNYFILNEKILEPEFQQRTDYDWIKDLARKMGVEKKFTQGKSLKEWAEYIYNKTIEGNKNEDIPPFEITLSRRERIYHFKENSDYVAFEKQILQPKENPFPTPSGKIEIFSKRLWDMSNPEIPALSHYVDAWEGPYDKKALEFPLQLISWKSKHRINSNLNNVPWLNEVSRQTLWINPVDSEKYKIKNRDKVKVFNDRGIIYAEIEITNRVTPGVIACPSGAWYKPNKSGEDLGCCVNVLSPDRKTALAHGNAHQSILVQIAKI